MPNVPKDKIGKSINNFQQRDYAGFLEAYVKNNGAYTTTCKELKIMRSTVDGWRKENPDFEADLQEVNRLISEKVESTLLDSALDPKGAPVSKIFYLKNNWREKYGERREPDNKTINLWFEKPKELPEAKIIEGEVVDE